jgi:hypothetical protein
MRVRWWGLAPLLALAAGCVAPRYEEARELLDDQTGTTVVAMGAPLEFYASRPELGLQAASFAHLGALEVNRMGERRLLLWLSLLPGGAAGVETTPTDDVTSFAIVADSKETTPPIVTADLAALGLSRPPFKRPADWAREGYYDVTLEELREFESAAALSLVTTLRDGRQQRYELWRPERTSLTRFLERTASP